MKNFIFISSICLLLATGCTDSNAQAQLRLQQQQVQQDQQKADQANTEKCAEQAAKSKHDLVGDSQLTVSMVYRNHYNRHLGKCFVLVSSSSPTSYGTLFTGDEVLDAYELTLYLDCYRDTPSSIGFSPYVNCKDAGKTFPASDVQQHIATYMDN